MNMLDSSFLCLDIGSCGVRGMAYRIRNAEICTCAYYSIDDLRYNRNVGIMFSREQLEDFLLTKNQLIEETYGFFLSN